MVYNLETDYKNDCLEDKISKSSLFELLELFKNEDEIFRQKCIKYVTNITHITENEKSSLENEVDLQNERRKRVAVVIAEQLIKTK